jgi:hypothetical protein
VPRRWITSLDPWQAEQDELDRLYEHEAPGDRPIWPPSPKPETRSAWGEHRTALSPDDISSQGLRATVPHTTTNPE